MSTDADPRWTPISAPTDGRAPRAWPRFMTARVAADYCDSSVWTIRRHVRPCGKRGRTLIYSLESVEAWMRGNADAPRAKDAPRNIAATPSTAAASLARVHSLAEYRQRERGVHLVGDDDNVAA
jgi:hypothetical protein